MAEEEVKKESAEEAAPKTEETSKPVEEKPAEQKPAEEQKPKKKNNLVKVLIIVGLAIVGLIIVVAIFVGSEINNATQASDDFVNALQSGDADTAYNLFSTEAKGQVPEDQFTLVVNQIGPILNTDEERISAEISASTGSDTTALVVYEIVGTDGETYLFEMNMVKEGGNWLVLNFESCESTGESRCPSIDQ